MLEITEKGNCDICKMKETYIIPMADEYDSNTFYTCADCLRVYGFGGVDEIRESRKQWDMEEIKINKII